jgi:DNA-binding PadR family transcriptional regulator
MGRHTFGSEGSHHHHGSGHGRHRGGRLFDYGELRLLILALLAERPRHGYELIKDIEERLGGAYTPSPGVVYPTLSWLTDMGYTTIASEEAGRKSYGVTPEGGAFLASNQASVDELLARTASADSPGRTPDAVFRAGENLKTALKLRMKRGPLDEAATAAIAAALDTAALAVERS